MKLAAACQAGPLIEHALGIKALAQADLPALKAEALLIDEDLAQVEALVAEVHKGLGGWC